MYSQSLLLSTSCATCALSHTSSYLHSETNLHCPLSHSFVVQFQPLFRLLPLCMKGSPDSPRPALIRGGSWAWAIAKISTLRPSIQLVYLVENSHVGPILWHCGITSICIVTQLSIKLLKTNCAPQIIVLNATFYKAAFWFSLLLTIHL
jgi:hypothetical protein